MALDTYWNVPEVKRFVKYEPKIYINQRLTGRRGLELIEHSETPENGLIGPIGLMATSQFSG